MRAGRVDRRGARSANAVATSSALAMSGDALFERGRESLGGIEALVCGACEASVTTSTNVSGTSTPLGRLFGLGRFAPRRRFIASRLEPGSMRRPTISSHSMAPTLKMSERAVAGVSSSTSRLSYPSRLGMVAKGGGLAQRGAEARLEKACDSVTTQHERVWRNTTVAGADGLLERLGVAMHRGERAQHVDPDAHEHRHREELALDGRHQQDVPHHDAVDGSAHDGSAPILGCVHHLTHRDAAIIVDAGADLHRLAHLVAVAIIEVGQDAHRR